MPPQDILLIDDDPHIRDVLRYALEQEGLTVHEAENGRLGLELAHTLQPTIIILDILMPEMNGLDVCRELRRTSRVPILFLSSKDSELDKILGLELGGDDYMSKPFSPRELVARVKVMLRRLNTASQSQSNPSTSQPGISSSLKRGNLTVNLEDYTVDYGDASVVLTATEFNLLELFLRTPQKVYSRDELCQADFFKDVVSERTIDSHIRRLRQKFADLGPDTLIETVHGFGYKMGSCEA